MSFSVRHLPPVVPGSAAVAGSPLPLRQDDATPPPSDHTTAITDVMSEARQRAASDGIAGVDILTAQVAADNPDASRARLFQALAASTQEVASYFSHKGTATRPDGAPKPGLTLFNHRFQIEPTDANVQAFGVHFFGSRRYPDMYGAPSIHLAGHFESAAAIAEQAAGPTAVGPNATINLKAPGLGANPTLPTGSAAGSVPRLSATAPAAGTGNVQPPLSLSPTAQRLLHDSHQHVQRIARLHQLPWGPGMDNTVAALALQAREQGLTAITHIRVDSGKIDYLQHDAWTNPNGSIDALKAANSPAATSLDRLATLDREQAGPPHRANAPETPGGMPPDPHHVPQTR